METITKTTTTTNIMPFYLQSFIQDLARPIGLRLDWKSGAPHAEPLNTYTENVDCLYKQPKYMTPSLRRQFSKSVITMKVSHKDTEKWYRQWFLNRKGQLRGKCRRKKRALPSSQRKFVPVLREPKKETMKIDRIFSSQDYMRENIYIYRSSRVGRIDWIDVANCARSAPSSGTLSR